MSTLTYTSFINKFVNNSKIVSTTKIDSTIKAIINNFISNNNNNSNNIIINYLLTSISGVTWLLQQNSIGYSSKL